MAFPTIPTGGRILTANQLDTTATRTFPSLTGLTKNSGDLLIAVIVAYQTSTGTNAAFSGWTGGFTEFHDSATATTLAIGCAYKWSTGSETGTFAVTQAGTITGDASMIVMSIAGAHASTPPEAGGRVSDTTALPNPTSFDPSGWASEDTLWINVVGCGMTAIASTWTGTGSSAPTNYSGWIDTNASDTSVIGDCEAAVSFRQNNASSEDAGTASGIDISNARNAALIIAVRPAPTVAITQAAYRFYGDGTETGSTALAAQDTAYAADVTSADLNLQLRIRLQLTTAVATASTDDWQLQYDRNASGSWTSITTSTIRVVAFASANITDAAATTNRLGAGSGSFVAGEISETGLVTDLGWTASNYTEVLYSLTLRSIGLFQGDVVTFRVLKNGVVTDMTYTVTPTLNITGRTTSLPTSGLVGWWDADNAASFTFGTGSAVAQWADMSGNNQHLVQATGANQPTRSGTLNSRSVVVYDGTSDSLAVTSWTSVPLPFTVCVVYQTNSITGVQAIVDGGDTAASIYMFNNALNYDAGTPFGTAVVTSTPYLVTWVGDGGNSKERLNSTQVGTTNTGSNIYGLMSVGKAAVRTEDYLNGFVAEVAVWNRGLSAGEITTVEAYFTTKWFVAPPVVLATVPVMATRIAP